MSADVAVRSVQKIESGATTVRLDILMRVLDALGIAVELRTPGHQ